MKLKIIIYKFNRLIEILIEAIIRPIDGKLGEAIRYFWYKNKFQRCGKNIKIGINVKFSGCKNIVLGNNVWIDDNCILIAGNPETFGTRELRFAKYSKSKDLDGRLIIGSFIHIAPNCLINSFGSFIEISDYCGLSSGVKIYAMSNHYRSYKTSDLITYSNPMVKKLPVVLNINPILIERNCFISLNVIILGGHIKENAFIAPNSVIVGGRFEANSIIRGNPGKVSGKRFR